MKTKIHDAPKERCNIEPQRSCQHVTKLTPKLEATEECVDVPKEVCIVSKQNPRKEKVPVIKKWCYISQGDGGDESNNPQIDRGDPEYTGKLNDKLNGTDGRRLETNIFEDSGAVQFSNEEDYGLGISIISINKLQSYQKCT